MLAMRRPMTSQSDRTPSSASHNDYRVVIVGYGPSGAIAANILGSMGIRALVLEKQADIYDKPRAIAIDHEIVRVLDNYGLLDAVRRYIAPFAVSQHFGTDYQLIRTISMVPEPYPLGYTPTMVFSQPPFEAALRQQVARLPSIDVELGASVIGLDQSASGARLTFTDAEGVRRPITADFVIGCDGASSTVRQLVGIELDDLDFDEPWVVVDMLIKPGMGRRLPATSANFCDPARPIVYVAGPENHRRWEIMLQADENPRHMQAPEQVWALLERWIAPEEAELWRSASYRFHALVAKEWRAGRVFLAGDAAHQQPPILGQGMCQGVRDVVNLTWKLERVLSGLSGTELLDTYGEERGAHARELILRIKRMGTVLCERDHEAAKRRDATLIAEGGGMPPSITRQSVIPGISGRLVEAGAASGTLFPQPWTGSPVGRTLMDKVHGHGWRLVVDRTAPLSAALLAQAAVSGIHLAKLSDSIEEPMYQSVHPLLEQESVVADWMAHNDCAYVLVRPDHYVYGTARTLEDASAMVERLNQKLAPAAIAQLAGEEL